MNYSKIQDYDYLVKDNSTGAVINTDKGLFEDIKNLLRELIKHGG